MEEYRKMDYNELKKQIYKDLYPELNENKEKVFDDIILKFVNKNRRVIDSCFNRIDDRKERSNRIKKIGKLRMKIRKIVVKEEKKKEISEDDFLGLFDGFTVILDLLRKTTAIDDFNKFLKIFKENFENIELNEKIIIEDIPTENQN
jgi:hypothetical protein